MSKRKPTSFAGTTGRPPSNVKYTFSSEQGKECDISTYDEYDKHYVKIRSHGKTDMKDDYAGVTMEFTDLRARNVFINRKLRYKGYRVPNMYHKDKMGMTTDHSLVIKKHAQRLKETGYHKRYQEMRKNKK